MKSVVGQVFRLELPSSEPLVGRSPTTRAASLATDEWRRRWQRTLAFVGELGGKRVLGSAALAIRLIRLFEVSTLSSAMRRLIIPCDPIRVHVLLATLVLATSNSAGRGAARSLAMPMRTRVRFCGV